MAKQVKSPAPKAPVAATANAPTATLFASVNSPITAETLRAFVNQHCGGNWSKVAIVPQDSVAMDWQAKGLKGPVPFGYNGGSNGPRATLQNKALTSGNAAEFMAWSKAHPQGGYVETPNRPHTLLALLNGGYSPSSKTWGTSFVHLAVA